MSNILLRDEAQHALNDILPSNLIDLVVTSPPYDNLRSYNGNNWNFETFKNIAKGLYQVIKPGGVLVWIVGDATVKGSETGSSFEQVLHFKKIGFNLHDTMIWEKNTSSFPSSSKSSRYTQIFEYMFILSKGKPKTSNLIRDKPNKYAGQGYWGKVPHFQQKSNKDVRISKDRSNVKIAQFGVRNNIWKCSSVTTVSKAESFIRQHPAVFPESLVADHIKSWSNPDDIILDCFAGSGTTLKVAAQLNRSFIGIERNLEYIPIIEKRLKLHKIDFEFHDIVKLQN